MSPGTNGTLEVPTQPTTTPPAPPPLDELVLKMREGDRDAAAMFVSAYGPMIRRRVRGKLGPTMRRLFDSMEILSTLSRRLDRYVHGRRLRASNETQLWALIFRMVDAALVDKVRLTKRLQSVEGEDSVFAQTLLGRLERAERLGPDGAELQIEAALMALPNGTDRQILSLWLMGNPLRVIADSLGISADALRQRWQAIREKLRERLEGAQ